MENWKDNDLKKESVGLDWSKVSAPTVYILIVVVSNWYMYYVETVFSL